jgi:glycosyltransferase involved in cell wall biosynthesis
MVFGQPNAEVETELTKLNIDTNVHLLGWMKAQELYTVFWAADAAIFPGTHSVVWEEAIGHGLATVFHRWKGMEHLDLGGNALFIDNADALTLDNLLIDLTKNDCARIKRMARAAEAKGPKVFSFSQIAERAINSYQPA